MRTHFLTAQRSKDDMVCADVEEEKREKEKRWKSEARGGRIAEFSAGCERFGDSTPNCTVLQTF